MDPFDVTTLPPTPVPLLLHLALLLAVFSWGLWQAATCLADWWATCPHDPADAAFIEIPADWGLADAVWCVCPHCGARTGITHARMRELELDGE